MFKAFVASMFDYTRVRSNRGLEHSSTGVPRAEYAHVQHYPRVTGHHTCGGSVLLIFPTCYNERSQSQT